MNLKNYLFFLCIISYCLTGCIEEKAHQSSNLPNQVAAPRANNTQQATVQRTAAAPAPSSGSFAVRNSYNDVPGLQNLRLNNNTVPFGMSVDFKPVKGAKTINITSDAIHLRGWVIDDINGNVPSELYLDFGGKVMKANYFGLPQKHIAKVSGAQYEKCGFRMMLGANSVSKGQYEIKFLAKSRDNQSYYRFPDYPVFLNIL